MSAKARRPPKHEDVPLLVKQYVVDSGRYLDTRHATERRKQLQITRPEVVYVLRHGRHEKRKDEFKEEHGAWTYAIRGKTVDGRNLRVCVSLDNGADMLIITAIDLDI